MITHVKSFTYYPEHASIWSSHSSTGSIALLKLLIYFLAKVSANDTASSMDPSVFYRLLDLLKVVCHYMVVKLRGFNRQQFPCANLFQVYVRL